LAFLFYGISALLPSVRQLSTSIRNKYVKSLIPSKQRWYKNYLGAGLSHIGGTRRDEMETRGFVRAECPKCRGNVYLEKDHFGWYQQCLQCGFIQNLGKDIQVMAKSGRGAFKHAADITGL
jgi:ssDNA-binding Zn-finger/Zn-ribbon topoisomerase 1